LVMGAVVFACESGVRGDDDAGRKSMFTEAGKSEVTIEIVSRDGFNGVSKQSFQAFAISYRSAKNRYNFKTTMAVRANKRPNGRGRAIQKFASSPNLVRRHENWADGRTDLSGGLGRLGNHQDWARLVARLIRKIVGQSEATVRRRVAVGHADPCVSRFRNNSSFTPTTTSESRTCRGMEDV